MNEQQQGMGAGEIIEVRYIRHLTTMTERETHWRHEPAWRARRSVLRSFHGRVFDGTATPPSALTAGLGVQPRRWKRGLLGIRGQWPSRWTTWCSWNQPDLLEWSQRDAGSSYPVDLPWRWGLHTPPGTGAGFARLEYAMKKSQSALRRDLLKELHRRSGGDVTRDVTVSDVAKSLNVDEGEIRVVAQQLAQKGSMKAADEEYHYSLVMRITMAGVEEAEKMDKPFLQRWPSEQPVLFGFLMSVITGLVMLLLGKLMNHAF